MEEELFGPAVIEQYTSFIWDTFAFNFDGKPLLLVSVEWGNECVLQVAEANTSLQIVHYKLPAHGKGVRIIRKKDGQVILDHTMIYHIL